MANLTYPGIVSGLCIGLLSLSLSFLFSLPLIVLSGSKSIFPCWHDHQYPAIHGQRHQQSGHGSSRPQPPCGG
ncbi:hypothetical protein B0I35DRAFT_418267, partial [Stachybotrys elegans]